jgi:hypothetical protein
MAKEQSKITSQKPADLPKPIKTITPTDLVNVRNGAKKPNVR